MFKVKGVVSGYFFYYKFYQVEYFVSGVYIYFDDKVFYFGKIVMVKIKFVSWEFFGSEIRIGDVFEVRELDCVVGKGVVKEIF